MFEDTDAPSKTPACLLDDLSIAELEDYITQLEAEIMRVKNEISRKQSHADAAAAFFKRV